MMVPPVHCFLGIVAAILGVAGMIHPPISAYTHGAGIVLLGIAACV